MDTNQKEEPFLTSFVFIRVIRGYEVFALLHDALRELAGAGERVRELRGVLAPRLCHLRTPPAAAAGDLGGFTDPVAGLEPLGDQVVAHGGDEADLPLARRTEQDAVAERLLLQRVDRGEELVLPRAEDLADDELRAAELFGAGEEFARTRDSVHVAAGFFLRGSFPHLPPRLKFCHRCLCAPI